eukprot:CAMPEP_0174715988 /NCGR_PEP_ID=MMETSP1094-20130205/22722_1 /TAXON_ID=156173 /ORGANISM="Chrysochromulina brevifilum, Strain UTEX LB 985" /LENGTH=296 /DNA_ID=CAMNT_0015915657 /DNA_START=40 /DNA_END=932 /DNA_ORIENTATION=-
MSSASALADDEGRKVFLGGLSFDAREDDLRSDFGKYGELEHVQLPMGEGGKHKGFAFITYCKADDAREACKENHQKSYFGREISARVVAPREGRGGDRGGDRDGGGRDLPQLPQEMKDKLDEWVAAKRQRDFETSDRLRAEMKEAGFNPETYRPPPPKPGGGYGGGGYGGDRMTTGAATTAMTTGVATTAMTTGAVTTAMMTGAATTAMTAVAAAMMTAMMTAMTTAVVVIAIVSVRTRLTDAVTTAAAVAIATALDAIVLVHEGNGRFVLGPQEWELTCDDDQTCDMGEGIVVLI